MSKRSNNGVSMRKVLLSVIAFAILFAVCYSGLHILESTVFNKEPESSESNGNESEKDDSGYFLRRDITTLLLIGVDEMGPAVDSGYHVNDGAADVVALVIFDEKTEKINIIALNRDSMVEMPVLGFGGIEAGTTFGQLALSHTYGNGLEESCENTVKTVEMLMGDITIDYYAALKMGGLPMLNDAVGGVTVNVTDDFSSIDPDITMGEYTLMGDEALAFVRSRKDLGDQLNVSRMERHREYVGGFMRSLKVKMDEDSSFAFELIAAVDGYLVTDCSGNTLMSMAERYENYELGEIVSPLGESVLGELYYEFYIDPIDLASTVNRLLYTEKLN